MMYLMYLICPRSEDIPLGARVRIACIGTIRKTNEEVRRDRLFILFFWCESAKILYIILYIIVCLEGEN